MNILSRKKQTKQGLPPGSLVFVGERKLSKVNIELIEYDIENCSTRKLKIDQLGKMEKKDSVKWLNITGIHDVDVIQAVGDKFNIHPLVLEDILNTQHRPKVDLYGDLIFTVIKMIYPSGDGSGFVTEQVSLVKTGDIIITFQENEQDVFGSIRDRICTGKGRIRKMRGDYLLYALIDSVVDGYFPVMETISDRIEELEQTLLENPDEQVLSRLHHLKRDLITLRRSIWPLREVINSFMREGSSIMNEGTIIYFRDVYDHTIQIMDTIEGLRDTVSGMMDLYMSSVSNKMNEVMKVLTIIATIFIPLTFIAGIYGMNFNTDSPLNMPELNWDHGYLFTLGAMGIVTLVMIIYFRRKKWL